MLVQLLALYTDHESQNTQHYRETERQTAYITMPIAEHIVLQYDCLKAPKME